jgi:hypothetical protein
MTGLEFMARLASIMAPPRYPLVRYAGVLGPRSAWRKDIVPRPRERPTTCDGAAAGGVTSEDTEDVGRPRAKRKDKGEVSRPFIELPMEAGLTLQIGGGAAMMKIVPDIVARSGDVIALAPNILSVRHWDRLLGGALYAATPRVDWANLLRRSFDVDVMACAECGSPLRVLAVITEREPVRRILAHLGLPTDATPLARARDPTDGIDDDDSPGQLGLA